MAGTAFNIAMATHDLVAFEAAARAVGFLGFGYYPRSGFMHIDLGPARSWGERFPARALPFAEETPTVREALAQSRTLKGAAADGAASFGAAGVAVAQEVLAEAQDAVLPLMPYLDTLRWVFIALALAGIALAIWARLNDWRRGCGDREHARREAGTVRLSPSLDAIKSMSGRLYLAWQMDSLSVHVPPVLH